MEERERKRLCRADFPTFSSYSALHYSLPMCVLEDSLLSTKKKRVQNDTTTISDISQKRHKLVTHSRLYDEQAIHFTLLPQQPRLSSMVDTRDSPRVITILLRIQGIDLCEGR